MEAIPIIWSVAMQYAVRKYNGEFVEHLSEFNADKCLCLLMNNQTEGAEFNQYRKKKIEEKKRLQAIANEERKKRNEAARQRRAKVKTEKEESVK